MTVPLRWEWSMRQLKSKWVAWITCKPRIEFSAHVGFCQCATVPWRSVARVVLFCLKSEESLEEGKWTMSSSSSEREWCEGQEYVCGEECDGCPQVTLPWTGQPGWLRLQGTAAGQKSVNFSLSYVPPRQQWCKHITWSRLHGKQRNTEAKLYAERKCIGPEISCYSQFDSVNSKFWVLYFSVDFPLKEPVPF